MDDSSGENEVRIIVARTYHRGRERARREGLPMGGPRSVKIISTDAADSGRAGRAMRLSRDQVIWDDGWWDGPYTEDVERTLRPCFV